MISKKSIEKLLKKYKRLLRKFFKYCDQLIVIGFNSQGYDIPLIRKYLPSSLAKLDKLPRFVIKKDRAYMVIASEKLKFLDLTNYLAPGTSLSDLYKSYGVPTEKGTFPYEWFSDLSKLDAPSLPPRAEFLVLSKDVQFLRKSTKSVWKRGRVWSPVVHNRKPLVIT